MLSVQRLKQGEERLLVSCLDRTGEVLVFLFKRFVWFSRRTEKIDQCLAIKSAHFGSTIFPRVGNTADVVPEKFQIQSKTAVGSNPDDFAERFEIVRLAVRRESHHFVFVAVIRKTEKLGQRRIKNA